MPGGLSSGGKLERRRRKGHSGTLGETLTSQTETEERGEDSGAEDGAAPVLRGAEGERGSAVKDGGGRRDDEGDEGDSAARPGQLGSRPAPQHLRTSRSKYGETWCLSSLI